MHRPARPVGLDDAIVDEPAKVNEDPEGAGWFVKIRLADKTQLTGLMVESIKGKCRYQG